MPEVDQISRALERDENHVAEELLPIVYEEWRRLAEWRLSNHLVLCAGVAVPGNPEAAEPTGLIRIFGEGNRGQTAHGCMKHQIKDCHDVE